MNSYDYLYPRKQLQRDSFFPLISNWKLNDRPINLPFPKESPLSQYENKDYEDKLTYTIDFVLPKDFYDDKKDVILNIGAVDQVCEVYFNSILLGHHEGGYLPFSFVVSDYLSENNNLTIVAKDNLDTLYPYGKQTKKPHGMWYTPISGIWQTIWLEAISKENHINSIKTTVDRNSISIKIYGNSKQYRITIPELNIEEAIKEDEYILDLKNNDKKIELWDPDNPHLYHFSINTDNDHVESYFAVRYIEERNVDGYPRLFLNDKPLLIQGVLDQGYYMEGIFLPEDYQEYQKDILRMKELGYNTIRKHIKVEPDIFYYYCDKLGMLVMQDMVNSGPYSFFFDSALPTVGINWKLPRPFDKKRYDFFLNHSKETIKHLAMHPCIFAYTIYNEGWGQQNADDAYDKLKVLDSERLFDSTSGWFAGKKSDFESYHIYFRNKVIKSKKKHPLLISECGGYVRIIDGHTFKKDGNYGYGKTDSESELTKRIIEMYNTMVIPSIEYGCCGFVFTQISDVEEEVNGIYTYDRKVCKVNKEQIRDINNKAFIAYKKVCEK